MTATEPRTQPGHTNDGTTPEPPSEASPAAAAPRKASLPYFASLDGLRGLGLIFVVTYHAQYTDFVPGAYLAVSMFFTLSGFLITSLMVREHDANGKIDMKRFYIQRFRRLMPAAYIGLALVCVYAFFAGTDSQMANFRADLFNAQFYVANWHFIASNQAYAELFSSPSPVLHFWSLAIEEQFYLLYPLVALVVLRLLRAPIKVLAGVVAVMFAVSVALPFVMPMSEDRFYYGTDTRGAEILAGVLLAFYLGRRKLDDPGWSPLVMRLLRAAGMVAFIVTVGLWFTLPRTEPLLYTGGFAVYGVLSAVLVWGAITPGALVARVLGNRFLVELGKISYGVYVYHWPIFIWLSPERTGLEQFWCMWLRFAVTLVAALLSNHYIETPIRRGLRLVRVPNWNIGVGFAVLTVVVILGVSVNAPEVVEAQQSVDEPVAFTTVQAVGPFDPPPTTLPASVASAPTAADVLAPRASTMPDRKLRLLYVGDSTARSLAAVTAKWGADTGVFQVIDQGVRRCGIVRGGKKLQLYQNKPVLVVNHSGDTPHTCDWQYRWPKALTDFQPDLIVVAQSLWDTTDHQLEGETVLRAPGDPVYDQKLEDEYTALFEMLDGAGVPVLWLKQPPGQWGVGLSYEGQPFGASDVARIDRLNELAAKAGAKFSMFREVPYDSFFSTWPGGVYDPLLRVDGIHPTGAGGDIVVGWLGPELLWHYWDKWAEVASR